VDVIAPPVGAWISAVLGAICFGTLWRRIFVPKVRAAQAVVDDLKIRLSQATDDAWKQMEPLNSLFDWSIPAEIAHETLPALEIDPVFSVGRYQDLRKTFGLDESIFGDRSVVGSASGEISGSPFVLVDAISQKWGEKTYTGTKTIHWTERIRDPNGKWRTVARSETLVATVTKPVPVHERGKFLLFGNPAAPDLRFSRDPSPLSAKDPSSRSTKKAIEREVEKLEAKARKLDPEHPFTLVANRDFEALFHAIDRDHPIQFRLLYTPLAQQQTVVLLRDKEQGWGDDFSLRKDKMISIIDAAHLSQAQVETPPQRYRSWELAETHRLFVSFCNEWFKHIYFGLAPLLCVPLYQQTRTHQSIYTTESDRAPAAPELESVANAFGEEHFRHPQSATLSLLKVVIDRQSGKNTRGRVIALGFRTEERIDTVSKWGGDGRMHDVSVPWLEYLPVQRETSMDVLDATIRPRAWETAQSAPERTEAWRNAFQAWNPTAMGSFAHRATETRFG
jgi:hypothetical protein